MICVTNPFDYYSVKLFRKIIGLKVEYCLRRSVGTVAQLVERLIRIQEAKGSTPFCSIFFISVDITSFSYIVFFEVTIANQ